MATARTSLAVQAPSGLPEDGVLLTLTAADTVNGNRFSNTNGNRFLVVRNGGASSYTVTFAWRRRGQDITRTAVTLAASAVRVFGPFPAEYGDHDSADEAPGEVYVTGNNAGITFAVVELPGLVRSAS